MTTSSTQSPQPKVQMPLVRPATPADLPAINAIYNFYVATSPATFDLEPVTEDARRDWFATRQAANMPILVAEIDEQIAESKEHAEMFKGVLERAAKRFAALAKVEEKHAKHYQAQKDAIAA